MDIIILIPVTWGIPSWSESWGIREENLPKSLFGKIIYHIVFDLALVVLGTAMILILCFFAWIFLANFMDGAFNPFPNV